MKCDGARPMCGKCLDRNIPEDCEYLSANAGAESRFLEERINLNQARIEELENPPQHSNCITLTKPYSTSQLPSRTASAASMDPPLYITEKLLDTFIRHSSDLGFFLYMPPFLESMLLPVGHPHGLPNVLIYATCLWCIYLSKDAVTQDSERHEEMYLSRATGAITDVSDTPHSMIHAIQAQVLIATYLFSTNRVNEGNQFVMYAVATVLASGLHKIRSTNGDLRSTLPPPRNSTEEGERILAAWTVFILDRSWAANLGQTPQMTFSADHLEDSLDTPWPLDIDSYVQGFLFQNIHTEKTLLKFLNNRPTSDKGTSILAVHAKATLLWERVVNICTLCSPDVDILNEMNTLVNLIGELKTSLPNLDSNAGVPNEARIRRLVICHSILNISAVRLHGTLYSQLSSASSKDSHLESAKAVLCIAASLGRLDFRYLNPIVGNIWMEAAQTLMDEIALLRRKRAYSLAEESEMGGIIRRALEGMEIFASTCEITNIALKKTRDSFESMHVRS